MKNKAFSLFRKVFNRKGTITVEYVVIIAAAVLLATFLIYAVSNDEVKSTIQETILKAINGETGSAGRVSSAPPKVSGPPSHDLLGVPNGETGSAGGASSAPSKDPGAPSSSASTPYVAQLHPTNQKNEEKGMLDTLRDGWNKFWGKANDVVSGVIEWGKEHKEAIEAGATVALGVGLLFVPGAQEFGLGILFGAALGGGVSYLSGNDLKTVMEDAAIGGVLGLVTGGIGGGVTSGVRSFLTSRIGAGLVSKIGPFLQRYLPHAIGGGAAGFADSALWDWLKGNKVSWKRAAISAVLSVGLVFGGGYLVDNAPKIINKINQLPWPPFQQQVAAVTGNGIVPMGAEGSTIGDTAFGHWLQKFAGTDETNVGSKQIKTTDDVDPNIVAGVKKPPVDINEFNRIRKKLGLPPRTGDNDDYTVAVLRIDGQEFLGKNGKWKQSGNSKNYNDPIDYDQKRIELGTNTETPGHAEGVAFYQALQYRKQTGKIGGNAVLYVDKIPCKLCQGGLVSIMRTLKLEKLDVYYYENGVMKHVQYRRDPETDYVYNPFSGKISKPKKVKK